jgi:hypothetical protein
MNKLGKTLQLLALFVFTLACFSMAQAQATRTWVSGVGDDVNPCSRTAPCKTFSGAISKTAAGGEIDALDPAGFGTITITKSITIDGAGTLAGILNSGGVNGITVNALSTDTVVLRNLSISGVGSGLNGINYIAGGFVVVDNVSIDRQTGSGIFMNLSNNGNLSVNDSRISLCGSTDNVDAGIRVTTTSGLAKVHVARTVLSGNRVGINVTERAAVFVRDSSMLGNQSVGLPAGVNIGGSTNSTVFLENCAIAHNNSGVRGLGTGGLEQVFMSNCDVYDNNNAGLNMASFTQVVSYQNNRITGNAVDIAGGFVNASPGQR